MTIYLILFNALNDGTGPRYKSKRKAIKMKNTPDGLIKAFSLLKVETSLRKDADAEGFQLADFPQLFRDALFSGLTQAPRLRPADWLIRDIIDLKLTQDAENSMGLAMILDAFEAALFDDDAFSFADWLKTWFSEESAENAAFVAFLNADDYAPRFSISLEEIKENADENEKIAAILFG